MPQHPDSNSVRHKQEEKRPSELELLSSETCLAPTLQIPNATPADCKRRAIRKSAEQIAIHSSHTRPVGPSMGRGDFLCDGLSRFVALWKAGFQEITQCR